MIVVHCDICDKSFKPYFPKDGCAQATGLCAEVYEEHGTWYIGAGYGSKFDMDIYKFTMGCDAKFKGANVCDTCIQWLLDNGKIVFYRDMMDDKK